MLIDYEGIIQRRSYHRILVACLALLSTPIVLMYLWLLLASVNRESLASFLPTGWTLQHWRFLWVATAKPGYPNMLSRYVASILGEGEVFVDYGLTTPAGLFSMFPALLLFAVAHKYLIRLPFGVDTP